MVTIEQPSATAKQTRFFDIVNNRKSSTLVLYGPRVGYFTTPAFMAQYPTNISNQARGITNQTMIIGLGQAFDGTSPITNPNPPGLDAAHASNPACLGCHWSLDPMRRMFRSNLTMYYSAQQNPAEIANKGMFLFGGVSDSGSTLYDLGKQIAAHPQFKTAWAQKLCAWANSATCLANDPELVRVAQLFADHNYDWNTLVLELFTSPLVTDLKTSVTAETIGTVAAITRRTQLCTTLQRRLGLDDVCASGGIHNAARALPDDGYTRGQVSALYVNNPDPFFRSAVEQICAMVADMVVDTGQSTLYSSASDATVTASIAAMVHDLMGLDRSRDAAPTSVLSDHYKAIVAMGKGEGTALKSTFTAACISPWVVSVGQ